MTTENQRLEIATGILSGFCANPAVFAGNMQNGWCLVNCTESDLSAYAVRMADHLLAAEKDIMPNKD